MKKCALSHVVQLPSRREVEESEGVPVRGYRVRSDREIRKKIFGPEASEMLKKKQQQD